MKKLLVSIVLGASLLFAQAGTKVATAQVAPSTATLAPAVQVFIPASGFTLAVFDPAGSVVLDTTTTPPTIRAIVVEHPVWIYNEATAVGVTPPATITLAKPLVAGTQLVYRNGVRQTPGLDYTVAGNVITFSAASALAANDNIIVDYRTQ
jgi:hypothetical protein